MKYLSSILLLILLTVSCSTDDGEIMLQELAPTLSVDLPEGLENGQTYEFEVLYKKTASCYRFSGFDVSKNENTIVVGVVNSYSSSDNNCNSNGDLQERAKLNFVAEREDFYIFKFWQGKSSVGEDKFLTIEVPVTPPGN